MTAPSAADSRDCSKILGHFRPDRSAAPTSLFTSSEPICGLEISLSVDMSEKERAMERIGHHPFVSDAQTAGFRAAQRWIEDTARQVTLPTNFCGGLLIMRLYRLIAPLNEQSSAWMRAVYEAAAAYDFAFLALGHADDEADMTRARDGLPTRFVTHPDTRSVDGLNLLLSGVTAMQLVLRNWPQIQIGGSDPKFGAHCLSLQILEKFVQALREASFPIILDLAGLGHVPNSTAGSRLQPLQIDSESIDRITLFARHRAHTYFMRAAELAALLAGYSAFEAKLSDALDKLFGLWGSLGSAADDLQDIFIDFASGVHSTCTVMAHLCVAENANLRPTFRRDIPKDIISNQRERLKEHFGNSESKLNGAALLVLLDEIELRKALFEHFEVQAALFATAIYNANFEFGFNPKLMIEIVSVVGRDPEFAVPDIFLAALEMPLDENVLGFLSGQVGKFITSYLIDRFWPKDAGE